MNNKNMDNMDTLPLPVPKTQRRGGGDRENKHDGGRQLLCMGQTKSKTNHEPRIKPPQLHQEFLPHAPITRRGASRPRPPTKTRKEQRRHTHTSGHHNHRAVAAGGLPKPGPAGRAFDPAPLGFDTRERDGRAERALYRLTRRRATINPPTTQPHTPGIPCYPPPCLFVGLCITLCYHFRYHSRCHSRYISPLSLKQRGGEGRSLFLRRRWNLFVPPRTAELFARCRASAHKHTQKKPCTSYIYFRCRAPPPIGGGGAFRYPSYN